MIFFKKVPGIAVIYRDRLEFKIAEKPIIKFQFPANATAAMEIKDKWEFNKELIKFLTQTKLTKYEWELLLDPEMIFEKQITAIGQADIDRDREKFVNELPFLNENVVNRLLMRDGKLFVQGTNRDLFQTIANTLRAVGGSVKAIATVDKSYIFEDKPEPNWFQKLFFKT